MSEGDSQKPAARRWALPLLAVAGLLLSASAVFYTRYANAGNRGSLGACVSNLKSISVALDMYASDNGGKYPATLAQLTPSYLRSIPPCPVAGKATYQVKLGKSAPRNREGFQDYYYIECHGGNHTPTVSGDFPAFTSEEGLVERADSP